MAREKKKYRISPRALGFIAAGAFLLMTPYFVTHEGYGGKTLIAAESNNPPFDKTLILVGRHNIDGATGFIVNKPLPEDMRARLSPFIRDAGIPVGYGGPLEVTEKIFVLEEKKPPATRAPPDFDISAWDDAVKATPDLLDRIRQSTQKGEQRYRVLTGTVGWGPFQLESEVLVRKNWRAIPSTHDIVFQNGGAAHWDILQQKQKKPKN